MLGGVGFGEGAALTASTPSIAPLRSVAAPGQDAVVGLWAQGEDKPSGHAAQYAAIIRSLQGGEAAPVSITDAYATMELAAAIYASSVSGTTVARGQIDEASPFFTRMDGHLEPWKQEEALNA